MNQNSDDGTHDTLNHAEVIYAYHIFQGIACEFARTTTTGGAARCILPAVTAPARLAAVLIRNAEHGRVVPKTTDS